jgi:excisionase family DNA binding protein
MPETINSSSENEDLICVKQAAVILGCAGCTVYGLCASGELPHLRVGRLIKLRRSRLRQWIAERESDNRNRGRT